MTNLKTSKCDKLKNSKLWQNLNLVTVLVTVVLVTVVIMTVVLLTVVLVTVLLQDYFDNFWFATIMHLEEKKEEKKKN